MGLPNTAGTLTLTAPGSAGDASTIYDAIPNGECQVFELENLGAGNVFACVEPLHAPGEFRKLPTGRDKSYRCDLPGGIRRVRVYTDSTGTVVTWSKQAILTAPQGQ